MKNGNRIQTSGRRYEVEMSNISYWGMTFKVDSEKKEKNSWDKRSYKNIDNEVNICKKKWDNYMTNGTTGGKQTQRAGEDFNLLKK